MSFIIRPASQADQHAIRAIVRAAHLNPISLHWRRFLVAVVGEQIVGTIQLRPHWDGTRELASLVVVPAHQHQRIGAQLVEAVQRSTTPPVYLRCGSALADYYPHFGFAIVEAQAVPRALLPSFWFANTLLQILKREERMLVMVWERQGEP